MRARAWCFTWNNPPAAAQIHLREIFSLHSDLVYLVCQMESAPTTGTPHLQGYVYLVQPITMIAVKLMLGSEAVRLTKANGSAMQNRTYCTKVESRTGFQLELGLLPQQGRRGDLLAVMEMIRSGSTNLDIWEDFPQLMLQYGRRLQSYRRDLVQARVSTTKPPVIMTYYGPTGTGKSRRATYEAGAHTFILSPPMKDRVVWLDGYTGQTRMIIEDFAGEIQYRILLRILDRYELLMQLKGDMIHLNVTHIWITSNTHPREWYSLEEYSPLHRRLTHGTSRIIHMMNELNGFKMASWEPPTD